LGELFETGSTGSPDIFNDFISKLKSFKDMDEYFKRQKTTFNLNIPSQYKQIMERYEKVGVYDPNQTEEIKQNVIKKKADSEIVIYGHTHVPFNVGRDLVGNTGCWIRGQKDYIHIHDGIIELKDYNKEL